MAQKNPWAWGKPYEAPKRMELNLQPTPPNNDGARPELLVTDKEAPSAAADTNPMATAAAKQADAVEDMAKSGTKAKSAPASPKKTTSKK